MTVGRVTYVLRDSDICIQDTHTDMVWGVEYLVSKLERAGVFVRHTLCFQFAPEYSKVTKLQWKRHRILIYTVYSDSG